MVEERDRFGWLGLGPGEEVSVDIGEVGVGNGFGGIGRHLRTGLANIRDEWREWNLNRADARRSGLCRALAFVAMTLVAAVAHI